MPELSTHLTFIADPGHGWLRVPLAEIVALGLETQISVYSYIEGQYAYLEEDCDCPRYLETRAAQGLPRPEITEQYVDRFAQPALSLPKWPSLHFGHASLNQAFWDHWRR